MSYVNGDDYTHLLSPNGRYFAYSPDWDRHRQHVCVYDFVLAKTLTFDLGRLPKDEEGPIEYLTWRQDSRAFAVIAWHGIAIIRLDDKTIRWITRGTPRFDSLLAWSPRTHRLALFRGDYVGESGFRIWNGKRFVSRRDWQEAIGEDRTQYETAPMQAEWSADEKSILLRFEGRSGVSGDFTNPMELAVLDADTGRARFVWKSWACPTYWLDNSRLIFQEIDDSYTLKSIVVARPKTRQHGEWLGNATAWALSPQRSNLWALTHQGEIYRTHATTRQWRLISKGIKKRNDQTEDQWRMAVSPSESTVALSYSASQPDQWRVTLVSTNNGHQQHYAFSDGSGEFIGWATGQELPIIAFQPNSKVEGETLSWQVRQLTR